MYILDGHLISKEKRINRELVQTPALAAMYTFLNFFIQILKVLFRRF